MASFYPSCMVLSSRDVRAARYPGPASTNREASARLRLEAWGSRLGQVPGGQSRDRIRGSRAEFGDGGTAGAGARARGRRGQAARAADRGPGQGGGSVRRPVPGGGLRAVQHGQRRDPAHLRAHPVQEPQPGPAHHHDLAAEQPARQLRGPGPGPAAARAALAEGLRGRDLPVAGHHPQRAARPGGGVRRRPRVPDGPGAADRGARSFRGRGDGGGHPGVTVLGLGVRRGAGGGRRPPDRGVRKSRPIRRGCRTGRTARSRRWGTTCSPRTSWSRRCARTRRTRAASTASGRT